MKRIFPLVLLIFVGCSKRAPPKPAAETSATPAATILTNASANVATSAFVPFRTVGEATVMVPSGFTVEKRHADTDVVLHVPSGGTIRLMTSGACSASLAVMCRRLHGEVTTDECSIGTSERLRVADGMVHHIKVEGDVSPQVLASWTVPQTAPTLGFYCATDEIIRNTAEGERE